MSDDTTAGASEVLSQSEVEAILASIGKPEEAPATILARRARPAHKQPTVSTYDFRSPSFLTPAELRRLRIKHEDVIRSIGSTVSMFLRLEFAAQMARLETMAWQHMLEALPMPSHLTIFRLRPPGGLCLLDLSPRLGLTVIDRILGGPGHGVKIEREFTDIEKVVLQNFVDLVIREYVASWLKYENFQYDLVESENSAKFLNIVAHDEIMLFLEIEARLGDCVAGMRFVIPFRAMEGIVRKMMAEITPPAEEREARGRRLPEDPGAPVLTVPVPVSLHWRGFSVDLSDLQRLELGDVLLLDARRCETAEVDLGQVPSFAARVQRDGPRFAARILGRLK